LHYIYNTLERRYLGDRTMTVLPSGSANNGGAYFCRILTISCRVIIAGFDLPQPAIYMLDYRWILTLKCNAKEVLREMWYVEALNLPYPVNRYTSNV
jgi:hypothetical protein